MPHIRSFLKCYIRLQGAFLHSSGQWKLHSVAPLGRTVKMGWGGLNKVWKVGATSLCATTRQSYPSASPANQASPYRFLTKINSCFLKSISEVESRGGEKGGGAEMSNLSSSILEEKKTEK